MAQLDQCVAHHLPAEALSCHTQVQHRMMSVELASALLAAFAGPFDAASVIQAPADLSTPSQVCLWLA